MIKKYRLLILLLLKCKFLSGLPPEIELGNETKQAVLDRSEGRRRSSDRNGSICFGNVQPAEGLLQGGDLVFGFLAVAFFGEGLGR